MSLIEDLKTRKNSLEEFKNISLRSLNYIREILTNRVIKGNYIIGSSHSASTLTFVRPINSNLFIFEENEFLKEYELFISVLDRLKAKENAYNEIDYNSINKISYTIPQSMD